MSGDVLLIEQKHIEVAKELAIEIGMQKKGKITLAIGGESGSGKSEIAESLRNKLRSAGFRVKILHMDNYYKVPPHLRNDHRRKHGMSAVGLHEINWKQLHSNINDLHRGYHTVMPFIDMHTNQVDHLITDLSEIDILLIEGLYACNSPADIRAYIDLTYHETMNAQVIRRKEIVDEFRLDVLEKEHQEVLNTKYLANCIVTPAFKLIDNLPGISQVQQAEQAENLRHGNNPSIPFMSKPIKPAS
jgi:uridine kinase